jgi:SAM-dependent methyltransferase
MSSSLQPSLTTTALGAVGRIRHFGESLAAALARLFSRTPEKKAFLVLNSDEIAALARTLAPPMPQAGLGQAGLTCDERDWRRHFSSRLRGRGIEIGALYKPVPRHADMQVVYVDALPPDVLRARYPELEGETLVEPDLIDDAATLDKVPDGTCDFLIAAHVLEHLPNPILALRNWLRVLGPGGLVYAVVPDKRFSFDRQRVRTSLEHLILDYLRPSEQRDAEHFLDYAALVHNARGLEAIREADRLQSIGHSIHFHVFAPEDVVALVAWVSAQVSPVTLVEGPCASPYGGEFHLMLRKPEAGTGGAS